MSPQFCVRQSVVSGRSYRVFGYKGKQVRDNILGFDLVEAFVEFIHAPRSGEVYNIGGSRHSNCSMLEAIALCEEISGRKLTWSYEETNRVGDHIWWISDVRKFQKDCPAWKFRYSLRHILEEIHRSYSAQGITTSANCSPRDDSPRPAPLNYKTQGTNQSDRAAARAASNSRAPSFSAEGFRDRRGIAGHHVAGNRREIDDDHTAWLLADISSCQVHVDKIVGAH